MAESQIFWRMMVAVCLLFIVEDGNGQLDIGSTIESATAAFENVKQNQWAKILLRVENYSKWALADSSYKNIMGTTSEVPLIIRAGTVEALAAHQDKHFTRTEGEASWAVSETGYCTVHWIVYQEVVNRIPNTMMVACAEGTRPKLLAEQARLGSYDEEMALGEFKDTQDVIQFCGLKVCIQGTMASSHQTTAKIFIIPLNASDLAADIVDTIDQSWIDATIGSADCQNNLCENMGKLKAQTWRTSGAFFGMVFAGCVVFVIVFVICSICCKS